MLIQNRTFLVGTVGFTAALAVAGAGLRAAGYEIPSTEYWCIVLEYVCAALLTLALIAICGSFLLHVFKTDRYIWLVPFFFLNVLAAMAYGLFVASREPAPRNDRG